MSHSLKHELSEADNRLSRERATAHDRLKVAHVDLETARREKDEVERHLRRYACIYMCVWLT